MLDESLGVLRGPPRPRPRRFTGRECTAWLLASRQGSAAADKRTGGYEGVLLTRHSRRASVDVSL